MPTDLRKLLQEIRQAGCSTHLTEKGHYLVLDANGNPIEGFAVKHPGKPEVLDSYVSKVRKALSKLSPSVEIKNE